MPATISINFTNPAEVQGTNPPTSKSVNASTLRSVLNAGLITGGYVTLAGTETITGAKTFSAGIAATTATVNTSVQVGVGSNGYVRLNNGTSTKPGYLAWFTPGDVRRGYLGWESGDTDNITFNLENGWGLIMNSPSKPVDIQGELSVSTSLSARESVFNRSVKVGVGPNGYVQLEDGTATKPGYLSWFTPDNVRRGYVGWESTPVPYDDENIQFKLENGWGLVMNSPSKPVVIMGDLEVTGSCDADNACKAWACYTMRSGGVGGAIQLLKGYNILAINNLGSGRHNILFTNPLPDRKYALIGGAAEGGGEIGVSLNIINTLSNGDDIPSTQPLPSNANNNTSGKFTTGVKVGVGNASMGINAAEAYVIVFG
jgi:hypothetical protein